MGLFGPYIYKSKSGARYFLHSRLQGKVTLYFFSKVEADALGAIPPGYEVIENEKTGLPMLKKHGKKAKTK